MAALSLRTPFKRQELNHIFDDISSQIEQKVHGQFLHQLGEAQGRAEFEEWRAKPFQERCGEQPTQPATITNVLLGEVQGPTCCDLRLDGSVMCSGYGSTPLTIQFHVICALLDHGGMKVVFPRLLLLSPELLLKIERRPFELRIKDSPRGERRKKDFSEWEISMARHIVSRDASRYLYGNGFLVSKHCAVSCLDRIEFNTREFAAKYLGYDPSPVPRHA